MEKSVLKEEVLTPVLEGIKGSVSLSLGIVAAVASTVSSTVSAFVHHTSPVQKQQAARKDETRTHDPV
jgi:hypothetical protein